MRSPLHAAASNGRTSSYSLPPADTYQMATAWRCFRNSVTDSNVTHGI